ncbi:MAG: RsmE family RNA methyltransferase [Candidatus Obscuribacterales bacterium]|jgi:16S rRNA (uracil1498-N3)-methyltransferase
MSKRHPNTSSSNNHKNLSHFFLPEQAFSKGGGQIASLVELDDAATAHQLIHVLRFEQGDSVKLLDGLGNMWQAKICRIARSLVTFELSELLADARATSQSKCQVVSMLPLLKGPRFELALEKLTELNVDRIIPFSTTRTVVKVKGQEESEGRQKRWHNIIKEAAEQSERLLLPILDQPVALADLLELEDTDSSKTTLKLLLSERDQAPNLVQYLEPIIANRVALDSRSSLSISILGGPEGGFTEEEKTLILKSAFQKVSLGSNILRGETAAILAAGIAYAIASTLD